jgi:hypothetical protein
MYREDVILAHVQKRQLQAERFMPLVNTFKIATVSPVMNGAIFAEKVLSRGGSSWCLPIIDVEVT